MKNANNSCKTKAGYIRARPDPTIQRGLNFAIGLLLFSSVMSGVITIVEFSEFKLSLAAAPLCLGLIFVPFMLVLAFPEFLTVYLCDDKAYTALYFIRHCTMRWEDIAYIYVTVIKKYQGVCVYLDLSKVEKKIYWCGPSVSKTRSIIPVRITESNAEPIVQMVNEKLGLALDAKALLALTDREEYRCTDVIRVNRDR